MSEVRLRSNVAIIRSDAERRRARESLPGDVATDILSVRDLTEAQRTELALYPPCRACQRSLWTVARTGCQYDCAAKQRAAALRDVRQTYEEARLLNEAGAREREGEVGPGRGRLEPVPEWKPGSGQREAAALPASRET